MINFEIHLTIFNSNYFSHRLRNVASRKAGRRGHHQGIATAAAGARKGHRDRVAATVSVIQPADAGLAQVQGEQRGARLPQGAGSGQGGHGTDDEQSVRSRRHGGHGKRARGSRRKLLHRAGHRESTRLLLSQTELALRQCQESARDNPGQESPIAEGAGRIRKESVVAGLRADAREEMIEVMQAKAKVDGPSVHNTLTLCSKYKISTKDN